MCQTPFQQVRNSWQKDYSQEETNVVIHGKCCWLSWHSLSFHILLSFLLTCQLMCVCTASVCTMLVLCNTNIPNYAWLAMSIRQISQTNTKIQALYYKLVTWCLMIIRCNFTIAHFVHTGMQQEVITAMQWHALFPFAPSFSYSHSFTMQQTAL